MMNLAPDLTVIIPALNAGKTIGTLLHELTEQTKKADSRVEIIVVDNGSRDNTAVIVGRFPVVLLHCHKKGAGSARNMGLGMARGKLVAFLDADIKLSPDWVFRALSHVGSNYWDIIQGPNSPVGKRGSFMLIMREALISQATRGTSNYLTLAETGLPQINTAAVIFRKKIFEKGIRFDEAFLRCEDTDLTLQCLHSGYHMLEDVELKSFVQDQRSPLTYLVRMFQTARYHAFVLGKWRKSSSAEDLFTDIPGSLILRCYFRMMNLCWKVGRLFPPSGEPLPLPPLSSIPRNHILFRKKRNDKDFWVLSSDVRLISLSRGLVFLDLRNNREIILDRKEKEFFIQSGSDSESIWEKLFSLGLASVSE